MSVTIQIRKEFQDQPSHELKRLKAEAQERLSLLRQAAQDTSNQIEALKRGEGELSSFGPLRSRASDVEVDLLSATIEIFELDVALFEAWRSESEEELEKKQEAIKVADSALQEAQERLKEANAPYWALYSQRDSWQAQQRATMLNIYELRNKRSELISRSLGGGVLPAPEPEFLEALSRGQIRAPEDLIN